MNDVEKINKLFNFVDNLVDMKNHISSVISENEKLNATQYGSGRLQALRDERDKLSAINAELVSVLKSIKERLDVCKDHPISVYEAYDSFYQSIVNEALEKAKQ